MKRFFGRKSNIQRLAQNYSLATHLLTGKCETCQTFSPSLSPHISGGKKLADTQCMIMEDNQCRPVKLSLSRRKYLPRTPSAYNYYFWQEMAALNEALPQGKRISLVEQRKQIRKRWLALSQAERIAITEARVQGRRTPGGSLADRERKDMAILEDVAKEMTEYLDQLNFSWLRKDHRDRIVQHSWVLRTHDIGREVQSLIKTQFTEIVDYKRKKMTYTRFDPIITRSYGVTIENWPPVRFVAPGRVEGTGEIIALYLMWKSGATRFRRLSAQEKEEWDATRLKLYKEHRRSLPLPRAPSTPSVPSRERPSNRFQIDPRAIGTIDQVSAFMDPVLFPKARRGRPSKAVTQEDGQ
ncbi:hypothetical protein BC629DRAFT_1722878 [Irpex lacteus]|nr:hypothetical protein BC629DRAFT_1722878 [Irpex lacteus]